MVVERNGNTAEVVQVDKADFVDENGTLLDAALQQKLADDVKELSKPKTPKPQIDNENVFETEAGKKGEWNKTLNNHEPNNIYQVKNTGPTFHTYHLDDAGITKVEGELKLSARDRNTYQQSTKCKKAKGGEVNDQGGHLVGGHFDGAGEQINLVPMNSSLNLGTWKAMENNWATVLQQGKKVRVEIKPIYQGTSKRPVAFEVRSWIDNVSQPLETFAN